MGKVTNKMVWGDNHKSLGELSITRFGDGSLPMVYLGGYSASYERAVARGILVDGSDGGLKTLKASERRWLVDNASWANGLE